MQRTLIPTCYFPSTIFFVDDSRDFLMNFTLQLNDTIAFKLHDSPYKALEALERTQQPLSMLSKRCFHEYLDASGGPVTNHTINLDLTSIHWEIFNPKRFAEVSTVVVDYAMPGMNGLEFCKNLGNNPVKRILLTGKADEKTAVQAFNEGIIDLFIQKQNINITHLINEGIVNTQQQYFQHMSDFIVKMLSVGSPSCLQDAEFTKLFYEIVRAKDIVEFYLTEDSGSFLMLDADANLYYLLVRTQSDIEMFYELAQDHQAPEALLNSLKSGEKIPCSWRSDSQYQTDYFEWSQRLYPSQVLPGREKYYYTLIEKPNFLGIDQSKITSYNHYLDEQDLNF